MRQAVNLYQPIFRTPRKVFGATMLAQMLGGALIALALMYGWSYWRLHTLTAEVAHLSAARVAAHARLDSLRQAYPARESNPLLAQELLRVSNEVERARALAGVLAHGAYGNTSGLSACFGCAVGSGTSTPWPNAGRGRTPRNEVRPW